MKSLILAGGFATRLRPLSCTRPKILFPIVNKPLLQWTFERLTKHDISEVILAVSCRTEALLKQYKVPKSGIHARYSRDPPNKPLGTAGPIKKAEKLIGHGAPFLVLNEDVFADVNYTEMLETHEEKDAAATIALHRVKDPSRYGVAELADDNRIERFIEKPRPGTARSNLINAGVYILSPKVFKYIPEGRAVSIEREVFPKLAEEGKLCAHVFNGLWMDIGKPEDYFMINRKMLDLLGNQKNYNVNTKAEVKRPVAVDKEVSLGQESIIGPYVVLGRDVAVGNGAQIRDSIVFPQTVISDFCTVNRTIIGECVTIGRHAKIGKGCIIGDHAKIGDNVTLTNNVSVGPAVEVPKSVLTSKSIC